MYLGTGDSPFAGASVGPVINHYTPLTTHHSLQTSDHILYIISHTHACMRATQTKTHVSLKSFSEYEFYPYTARFKVKNL